MWRWYALALLGLRVKATYYFGPWKEKPENLHSKLSVIYDFNQSCHVSAKFDNTLVSDVIKICSARMELLSTDRRIAKLKGAVYLPLS
jgi:hypothetical protein